MKIEYQPKARTNLFHANFGKGSSMHAICDVCGKLRRHGNHDKCSKARQAAGFLDDQENTDEQPSA